MSLIRPRLTTEEFRAARRAGVILSGAPGPAAQRSSFFGAMFSWFSSVRFGATPFLPVGSNAKPPVNSATAATGQNVTQATALTLSAVWACVWLNARTMASLPFELKRYDAAGRSKLAEDETLFEVLRWQPNADMAALQFWTAMWAAEQLWGTAYAYIQRNGGKVIGLEFLLPQYMTAYQTEKKQLRFRYDDPRNARDFAGTDIFRLFTRSLDGLAGMSVIEFARNSFGLAQSGELAASQTFKKGLNASGFVTVEKFLKPEQREMIRTSVDEFTGEGEKAGGVMVLEGGFDYKQLSMKPLDAELLSSRQFSVEDVCRWFGVPPILIGHASQGQTMWGSGVEQIFGGWARLSLRPYTTAGSQAVRQYLVAPADRAALYAEYDLDDLLAADSTARAALYASLGQNGVLTRNEIREKEGKGPMPGGDILTVQSNLVPLNKIGEAPEAGGPNTASEKMRTALLDFLNLAEKAAPPPEAKP